MFTYKTVLTVWAVLATVLSGGLSARVWAQSAAELSVRSMAATCAGCHGTEGRAVAGSAVQPLAGMGKEYFIAQLQGFKSGARPATVMHQLSKGYSQEQIEQLASYFAAQKKQE